MRRCRWVLGFLLLLAGCGESTADADSAQLDAAPGAQLDAAPEADAGVPDGAPPDAAIDAAQPDMGTAGCGDERLPVDEIRGTEGLAITTDGTLYYAQSFAVGRRLPGGDPLDGWVDLPGASTVWGLAWRAEDQQLFAASPDQGGLLFAVDTTAAGPQAQIWLRGAGAPNGLVIGPDGLPYYTDFSGGHVYRVDGRDAATQISAAPIAQANGLLFDTDGTLLVLAYGQARVYRLTLDAAGLESGREEVHQVPRAALDGIARDDQGRYYLGDNRGGRLLRYDANFEGEEVLLSGVTAAANIVFGRGALRCTDVYVASQGTLGVADIDD